MYECSILYRHVGNNNPVNLVGLEKETESFGTVLISTLYF